MRQNESHLYYNFSMRTAYGGEVNIGTTAMEYVRFGNGAENLIILPGLSDGLSTVKGMAWVLSMPYRKYMRDYTIYMFSRKNEMPEGYTIEEMANDQATVLGQLGITKTAVFGVSQGGMIAQALAIRHPEWLVRDSKDQTTWVKSFLVPGYHRFCMNTPYLDNMAEKDDLEQGSQMMQGM